MPLPLWAQIERTLRDQIDTGAYKEGDQIPPEPELAAMYGVSRMTVRQAVSRLVAEGLLTRWRGRGTFVAKPPLTRPVNNQYLDGFFATLKARGHSVVSRVLSFDRRPAEPAVGAALGIGPGVQVYRLERLRFVDDLPVSIQITYLPALPLTGLDRFDFAHTSLYQVLKEAYAFPVLSIDQWISARTAAPPQASLLQVAPGSALLYVEKVSCTTARMAIEYGQLYFVPNRYQLTMSIRT